MPRSLHPEVNVTYIITQRLLNAVCDTLPSNNTPATGDVLGDIRAILAEARVHAAKVVNSDMVAAYWLIGRRIVLEEQRGADKAKYGEQLLQNLSRKLETEYGNGFSYANLRNMRQFCSIALIPMNRFATHCVSICRGVITV